MLLPLLTHREGDSPAAEQGALGVPPVEISDPLRARTSEEIYGISEQPSPTCPLIDSVVATVEYCENQMRRWERFKDDPEHLTSVLENVECAISNITPDLEKIRDHACLLRQWGQEWKEACAPIQGATVTLDEWQALVARYLASNGEFGLYDAGAMLNAGAELAALLPPNAIAHAQCFLRQRVPQIPNENHNATGISAATKANKATSSSVTDSGGMA